MTVRHGHCHSVTYRLAIVRLAAIRFAAMIITGIVLATTCSLAQRSISLFDIDTTRFPLVTAKFYAFDVLGARVTSFSPADCSIIENGTARTVTRVTCAPNTTPAPISSVLSIDISKSMEENIGGSGVRKIDMAKAAAAAWVTAMPLGSSECAVTSFGNLSYLNQDFTTNRQTLLDAIAALSPNGASDFDAAFLRPPGGAIPIAARGSSRRVVVLITDGVAAGTEGKIIKDALDANVAIYCITLGVEAPEILKRIAEKTGGAWFENVSTVEETQTIYRRILSQSQNLPPCTIEWRSVPACDRVRNVEANLGDGWTSAISYLAPESSTPLAVSSSAGLEFGPVPAGSSSQLPVTISARGGDLTVRSISTTDPRFVIMPPPPPPPFTLASGGSLTLWITFTPTDSSYVYAQLRVVTDGCSETLVHLTGGFLEAHGPPTLTILRPNGGEFYPTGLDTLITWTGVQPTDAVHLEYSTDDGTNWREIAPAATGLQFSWRVPNTPSTKCRVRATHVLPRTTDSSILFSGAHAGGVYAVAFSPDGGSLVTGGDDMKGVLWNARSATTIRTFSGHTDRVRAVAYSADGRWIATGSYDGSVKIWHAPTGVLTRTLTGHTDWVNSVRFSPDGATLVTGSRDGTARIWRISDGAQLKALRAHSASVTDARFNADGTRVATASSDKSAAIWDAASGRLLNVVDAGAPLWSVAFLPGERRIVTGGDDRSAAVWDIPSGSRIMTLSGHLGAVRSVDVSPDGAWIATASDDATAMLWSTLDGTPARTLLGHRNMVRSIAFSHDGRLVATGSADSTARIWQVDRATSNRDITDGRFSIIAPALSGPDTVDFGKVPVNTEAGKLVAFLRNDAVSPIRVSAIGLRGMDAGEFAIRSGFAPVIIGAADVHAMKFSFTPTSIGLKYATVEIVTLLGTLRRVLRGEGVDARIAATDTVRLSYLSCDTHRDTTITITNDGSTPLTISRMDLTGADSLAFQLDPDQGGVGTLVIPPGGSAHLVIRFSTTKPGVSRAVLRLSSDATNKVDGGLAIDLRGVRELVGFSLSTNALSFGKVKSNTTQTLTFRLTNTGTIPLSWSAPIDLGAFRIQSIVPSTIAPSGSATVTVTFTPPVDDARFDTVHTFVDTICGITGSISLSGASDVLALLRLGLPDTAASPGSTISIPIYVREARKLQEAGVTAISFWIWMDATLLIPYGSLPAGTITDTTRAIQINTLLPRSGDSVLTRLTFRVANGDHSSTRLVLGRFASNGSNVTVTADTGSFTLVGLCDRGGSRLVSAGKFGLRPVAPNPIGSGATIRFDLVESGQTKVWLTDMAGKEVAVLVDRAMAPGSFSAELDAAGFSQGIYLLHLATATEHEVERIVVRK